MTSSPNPLPTTAFSATSDSFASTASVEAWRDYCDHPNEFRHYQFSGGHYFLETEREPILEVIDEVINANYAQLTARAQPMHWSESTRPVVVFLAGGGAEARDLAATADGLGSEVECLLLEPPGHGKRASELPLRRLQPLAALLERDLATIDAPLILFGHGISAHISFEIARLRLARGLATEHLIVSCSMSPSRYLMPPLRLPQSTSLIASAVRTRLLAEPRTRASIDADLSLAFHYQPDRSLVRCTDLPITAVVACDDEFVPPSSVPDWEQATRGQFLIREVEGGHMYFWKQPKVLLDIVQDVVRAGQV